MKLTLKDLKQQKFTIDAEPSETIGEVKAKIQKEKGWEPSQQRLIYSGKILQDSGTVESYKIEEKGFIVCMVNKPKAALAAAASSEASKSEAKPPSTPAPAPAQTPAAPPAAPASGSSTTRDAPGTPTPASVGTAAGTAPTPDGDAGLVMGEARSAAIENMVNMGFERDQAERAMRAAFNNPDRAVDYLLNGIPANLANEASGARAPAAAGTGAAAGGAATTPAPAAGTGGEEDDDAPVNLFEAAAQAGQNPGGTTGGARGAAAGAGAETNLDFLRNNPQFQQLRQIVQQQPQMLEPILQQVAAGNPQLAALIQQNPTAFVQLLGEGDGGEGEGGEGAPLPPGAQTVAVTEEERQSIERLCSLGFERDLVIQAYFACDKDEELTANFLFDSAHEDDAGA